MLKAMVATANEDFNLCDVCYEQTVEIAFTPCMHSYCGECAADSCQRDTKRCAICRGERAMEELITNKQERMLVENRALVLRMFSKKLREVLDDGEKRIWKSLTVKFAKFVKANN